MSGAVGLVDPFPPGPPRGAPAALETRFDRPLTNGRAAWLCLWIVLGFALTGLAILLLPSARYVRYQQEADTIQFHARWVYERIHFDPAPIDVAIIGTSRLEAGVSPVELQRQLSAKLGRPVHVADLALVQMGRNLHYAIAKDLLNTRPEVKLIVLSTEEGAASSHPLFKYVGDDVDVARSPLLLNLGYFDDLFYLPIRHLTYFVETVAPFAFGIDPRFQPSKYLGTDLDRTTGYRTPEGTMVNGPRTEPPDVLRRQAEIVHKNYRSTLRLARYLPPKYEYAVDYRFTQDIVRLAAQHHVKLIFLHLPTYGDAYPVDERAFYESLAPYLDDKSIGREAQMYADGAHLNRAGALATSRWLADRLAPYLAAPKAPVRFTNGGSHE
jgi:hypothetical protein